MKAARFSEGNLSSNSISTLEASVYSEEVLALLSELAAGPEPFEFLGSYTEL